MEKNNIVDTENVQMKNDKFTNSDIIHNKNSETNITELKDESVINKKDENIVSCINVLDKLEKNNIVDTKKVSIQKNQSVENNTTLLSRKKKIIDDGAKEFYKKYMEDPEDHEKDVTRKETFNRYIQSVTMYCRDDKPSIYNALANWVREIIIPLAIKALDSSQKDKSDMSIAFIPYNYWQLAVKYAFSTQIYCDGKILVCDEINKSTNYLYFFYCHNDGGNDSSICNLEIKKISRKMYERAYEKGKFSDITDMCKLYQVYFDNAITVHKPVIDFKDYLGKALEIGVNIFEEETIKKLFIRKTISVNKDDLYNKIIYYCTNFKLQDTQINLIMRFLNEKDEMFYWFKEYFYTHLQGIILERLHFIIQNLFNNTDKEHNFKNFFLNVLERKIKKSTEGNKYIFSNCMLLSDIEKCFGYDSTKYNSNLKYNNMFVKDNKCNNVLVQLWQGGKDLQLALGKNFQSDKAIILRVPVTTIGGKTVLMSSKENLKQHISNFRKNNMNISIEEINNLFNTFHPEDIWEYLFKKGLEEITPEKVSNETHLFTLSNENLQLLRNNKLIGNKDIKLVKTDKNLFFKFIFKLNKDNNYDVFVQYMNTDNINSEYNKLLSNIEELFQNADFVKNFCKGNMSLNISHQITDDPLFIDMIFENRNNEPNNSILSMSNTEITDLNGNKCNICINLRNFSAKNNPDYEVSISTDNQLYKLINLFSNSDKDNDEYSNKDREQFIKEFFNISNDNKDRIFQYFVENTQMLKNFVNYVYKNLPDCLVCMLLDTLTRQLPQYIAKDIFDKTEISKAYINVLDNFMNFLSRDNIKIKRVREQYKQFNKYPEILKNLYGEIIQNHPAYDLIGKINKVCKKYGLENTKENINKEDIKE